MSAQPSPTTNAEAWTKWQNQVVQERFALRRCLGWTDHSAVFLTEHKSKNLAEAAIKFVRADAPQAQALLVRWQAAVNLSHPHLVQLFEVGRWQSGGHDYLYVVMEYADQTLAEILRRRPLSAEETQELLPPVLEALTFLHRRQLVQGQLKPSNFLAVGDQLKLASDTIRPAGQDHGTSTAGDVWNLGATLVEALTARSRTSTGEPLDVTSLPTGVPATLVETIRRCLSPMPADRPSIIELRAENKPAPVASAAKPEPVKEKVPQRSASQPTQTARRDAAPPAPREPLQPIQTASRVAVSLHYVPSASQAAAPPAPGASRDESFHQASLAPNRPQVVASPIPSPGTPREVASSQPANTASQAPAQSQRAPSSAPVIAPSQPAPPSSSREVAAPQSANISSQAPVRSQPASSGPGTVVQPQPVVSSSQATAPPKPVPSTSHEATPQSANITSQAPVRSQPAPSSLQTVAQSQPAVSSSQATAPLKPVPSTSHEAASRSPNITSRAPVGSQPAPGSPQTVAQPQPAPSSSREVAASQSATITPQAPVRSQPASSPPGTVVQPQLAASSSQAAPLKPVPSTSQEAASQSANITSQAPVRTQATSSSSQTIAPLKPVPSTSHEAASQSANISPQAPVRSLPAPGSQQPVTQPQPAPPSNSRDVAASQSAPSKLHVVAAPNISGEITAPHAASVGSRVAISSVPGANTSRDVPRPQPAPNISRRPISATSQESTPSESAPKRHFLGIAAGAFLLVIAVWIGLRPTDDSPAPSQTASVPAPATVVPSAPAKVAASKPPLATSAATTPAEPAPETSSAILHEVLPTVPDKIQNKIQGRVYVTVRVLVDPAGDVMGVLMENAGPSKYFARLSDQAARDWQFIPADVDAARVWLLRFEYTRNGVAVRTFEQ